MSIIYALVGTGNRALRHSNSNNQIVIGDFNSFRGFSVGHPVHVLFLAREPLCCSMDHLRNRLNFDLNKSRQKFHRSLKEHHKISNIPKFRCEML